MRIKRQVFLALSAFLATAALGCGGEDVGRKCFSGFSVEDDQAIIASPALECSSRQCLHVPQERELPPDSQYADLCTAECSEDSDCNRVDESPCQTGFTCAIPVTVGPFCCRKLCICKDYLVVPEGGRPIPAACDPDNAQNECCNLPGRENSAACGA